MPLAKWNIEATMPTMYSAKNTGFATMSAIMEKPGSTPNSACNSRALRRATPKTRT